MKSHKLKCACHTCEKILHYTKHFTADDGRILCYKCRTKEKAKPATGSFISVLGIKK